MFDLGTPSSGYKNKNNTQSGVWYCQISLPKSRRTRLAEPRTLAIFVSFQPIISVGSGVSIFGVGRGADTLGADAILGAS